MGKSLLKPVYTEDDVQNILGLMKAVPYNTQVDVSNDISARWRESGHILGSASIELTVKEDGKSKVVVFSGDIGPDDMAIIKDPEPFSDADLVFMESTYGDHDHKSLQDTLMEGKNIIEKAFNEKGKILVPAFAVGRTQQLLYYIARAVHRGNLPMIPIYLDSPMAIEATKIYVKHKELYDDEAAELFRQGVLKGDFTQMHISKTAEESMQLNEVSGPCMIIAGAGMCNAGRILHHLKHNLWKPQTTVMIVGYQGQGSLGRKLLDGENKVKIYGEEIAVKANIASMGGLSAHADQSGLIKWFGAIAKSKPKLVLSHGEDRGRKPLAKLIKKKFGIEAILPKYSETIKI
ncbi:MAG: Ribonuclease [Ignavibacteria bacterium]|nr:Ribonuclease [Ignavibacteria bacterium]